MNLAVRQRSGGWRGSLGRPAEHPRRIWLGLAAIAGALGAQPPAQRIEDLRRELARAERSRFPVEGESARLAATGFASLVRAFVQVGDATAADAEAIAARRERLAPAITAAAKVVDGLLQDERARLADATWRRQFPEDRSARRLSPTSGAAGSPAAPRAGGSWRS